MGGSLGSAGGSSIGTGIGSSVGVSGASSSSRSLSFSSFLDGPEDMTHGSARAKGIKAYASRRDGGFEGDLRKSLIYWHIEGVPT
jgi:hypothetical protein